MTADAHTAPRVRVAGPRRPTCAPLVRRALGAALAGGAACLLFATPAGAAATRIEMGSDGNSVTEPMGLVRTPEDGALWVADSARGVCRVDESATPAKLVDSDWCRPGEDQHLPPDAPAGLAYDADTKHFYVGDGASNAGGVWRLDYDPDSHSISGPVKIVPSTARVEGVALGGGNLYFTTKGSAAVQRVTTPHSVAGVPQTVGFAATEATSLTYLDGSLYLAEGNAVTRLDLAQPGSRAVPVPGLANGLVSAVIADPGRDGGRVYAATNNESGLDNIDVLHVGSDTVEPYDSGYAGISAIGLEEDGDLLVGDDPQETVGAIDNVGYGRLWLAPLTPLGRPNARLETAPRTYSRDTTARFTYTSSVAGATFQCRLDGASWAPCPETGPPEQSYDGLLEGAHVFEVRAVHPDLGAGNVARRTFVVDWTAPSIEMVSPQDGSAVPFGPVDVDFAGSEAGMDFWCSVDGADAERCDPVVRLQGLEPGEHTFRITGEDLAGNPAEAVEATFRVRPKPQLETEPGGPSTPSSGGTVITTPALPSIPTTAAPAGQGQVLGVTASAGDATALRAKRLRVRDRVVLRRNARSRASLRVDFAAPAGAYSAAMTVRDFEERRGVRVHAKTRIPVESGRVHLRWLLTRAETRRLRAGRYRVTVTIRNARGTDGETVSRTLVVRSERR